MVGTPAVKVTCSPLNSSNKLTGSRWGPGKTCFAPTMVQVKGNPHALTWNMGTTGRTTSCREIPKVSAIAEAKEWSTNDRWL